MYENLNNFKNELLELCKKYNCSIIAENRFGEEGTVLSIFDNKNKDMKSVYEDGCCTATIDENTGCWSNK